MNNENQNYDEADKKVAKLEKNTKFLNKIKDADGNYSKKKIQEAVLKNARELNLSKYTPLPLTSRFISEITAVIVDCQLYPINIKFFMELSSILHQNYSDFSSTITKSILKHIDLM